MSSHPFFSIIIPALNEERYLPDLLEDLSVQTFRDFRVHLVDGSSEDRTVARAKEYQDRLNLTVHTTKKRNVSYQRNLGAKKAQSEWLIFMDADNRLPSYFLDGIKYKIAKYPTTDLFTCWCKTESDSRTIEKTIERALNFGIEFSALISKPTALGALIGCRKDLLKKIKFDETQRFLEDGYFVQEAVKAHFHYRVFREPQFTYSLRRIQKEGILKNVRTTAQLQIQYLLGKKFDQPVPYLMEGGSYYDEGELDTDSSLRLLSRLQTYLQNATKKQREQAHRLIQLIRTLE